MTTINLGNGGVYSMGTTYYHFKPYRPNSRERAEGGSGDYKSIVLSPYGGRRNDIPVLARAIDNGELEERTIRDDDGTVLHIQPRYEIEVLGWGSSGGNLFPDDFKDPSEFERLWADLREWKQGE